jgi:peptidoglycan glycosyltransferase
VNGPLRRLAGLLVIGFALMLGMATWVQVIAADRYRLDPRNPRPGLTQSGKERGRILAGDETILAESLPDPDHRGSFIRVYPEGAAFTYPVGWSSREFGENGLEEAYSTQLRSRRDLTLSDLLAALLGEDLRPHHLVTTIDPAVQRAAYQALDGQAGAVVAIDPATGAILAMVSSPSFDPAILEEEDAETTWAELSTDPARPLLDRSTEEHYPPGSTFKTVVAGAAIDTGTAGPETAFPDPVEFQLPGSTATISNFDGEVCNDGIQATMEQAFVRSCNTIFAELSIETGAEEIGLTADASGFNRQIPFPWPLAPSVFPTAELIDDPAALAQSGIGERDVRATPLVMAMVAAGVANQGVVMQPYLVARIIDAEGQAVEETLPIPFERSMAAATAGVVSQMMEEVVSQGTGTAARIQGMRVAGKTGTSSGAGGLPNAWFIGYAPAEAPTIAVAVVVEAGGKAGEDATGGSVAAPIARQVLLAYLDR